MSFHSLPQDHSTPSPKFCSFSSTVCLTELAFYCGLLYATGVDLEAFVQKLMEEGVLLEDCSSLQGPTTLAGTVLEVRVMKREE